MTKEEIEYLRKLDKQGLSVLTIIPNGERFIVHQNTQNKISYDFIAKRKKISEFLDHSNDEPGLVHLYAETFNANKRFLSPETYEELLAKEKEEFKKFTNCYEYSETKES